MNQKNVEALARVMTDAGMDTYFSDVMVAAELLAEHGVLVPSVLTDEQCADLAGEPVAAFSRAFLRGFREGMEQIAKGEE